MHPIRLHNNVFRILGGGGAKLSDPLVSDVVVQQATYEKILIPNANTSLNVFKSLEHHNARTCMHACTHARTHART